MSRRKKELTTKNADAAKMTVLQKDGLELPDLFTRDILLMNTMLNGVMHVEDIYELALHLKKGDRVKLILEPKNPYDKRAIVVKTEANQKLGYIPMQKNEVLFHLLGAGKYLYGRITGGDIDGKKNTESNWVRIFIDVFMRD